MSDIKTRKANGISFVERNGGGPCFVFLHGIGSNADSFRPVFDLLPSNLHLLAWNAPGYGRSDALAVHWPTAEDYAKALHDFLSACGLGPVVLIGHSLGTLIAAAFARAYPEQVLQLVLAACASGYGVPVGGEMPASVGARISELEKLGPVEFARTRAARLVYEPEQNPQAVARVKAGMSNVEPAGYAQAVRMLANGALPDAMRGVTVRCGFIIGAEDQVTPEQQTLDAAQAFSEAQGAPARIERIAEAGHAVYMQQPAAFTAAMLRLIAGSTESIGETND